MRSSYHRKDVSSEDVQKLFDGGMNMNEISKHLDMNIKTVRRRLGKDGGSPVVARNTTTHSAIQSKGGLDTFRQLFDPNEIQKRRTSKIQEQVQEFIDGPLKSKKWITDSDARAILGLSSVDYSIARQDHSSLIFEPLDENRRKTLIWVHPSEVDSVRKILAGER